MIKSSTNHHTRWNQLTDENIYFKCNSPFKIEHGLLDILL